MDSSSQFSIDVPARIINGASKRKKSSFKGASRSFKKLMLVSTLAIHPIHGHFTLKSNTGKGQRLQLTFGHKLPCRSLAHLSSQMPGKLHFVISGKCCCVKNSRLELMKDTIKSKMNYVKKWDDNWMSSAQDLEDDTTAAVFCGFAKGDIDDDDDPTENMETDETDSDDDISDDDISDMDDGNNEASRIQQVREVVTETEIEEGGRELCLEIGGWLLKLIKMRVNLLKIFHKSPIKKTKTKVKKRYYKK